MKNAIKSEFRKLYTIRSTYMVLAFTSLFTVLIAFYAKGLRAVPPIVDSNTLSDVALIVASVVSGIVALVGAFNVTQEYRNNTVTYTITSAQNRLVVFASKVIVISIFAVFINVLAAVIAPLLAVIGMHLHHVSYTQQYLDIFNVLWRVAFAGWAYSMLALIIAFIARNMVASVVVLLVMPSTVEPLLGFLIKSKHAYLPFTALGSVLQRGAIGTTASVVTVLVYIIIGGFVAWQLFLHRDAN